MHRAFAQAHNPTSPSPHRSTTSVKVSPRLAAWQAGLPRNLQGLLTGRVCCLRITHRQRATQQHAVQMCGVNPCTAASRHVAGLTQVAHFQAREQKAQPGAWGGHLGTYSTASLVAEHKKARLRRQRLQPPTAHWLAGGSTGQQLPAPPSLDTNTPHTRRVCTPCR